MTRKQAEECAITIKLAARQAARGNGTVDTWTTQVVELGEVVSALVASAPVQVANCLPTGWSFARSDGLTSITVCRRL